MAAIPEHHTHRSVRLFAKIFVACLVFGASTAAAGTLQVGIGKTYANLTDANAAAADGDVIEIDAGTYRDVISVTRNNLTIRGVGGHAVLDATGVSISNGKAIIVSAGNDDTYENLDFIGATVPDENGAGVRWEGGGTMTIRHCLFKNNENGILGGHPVAVRSWSSTSSSGTAARTMD